GRELDARRGDRGRLYVSTQEQIALARLGRALAGAPGHRVAGTLGEGGVAEEAARARIVARPCDAAALALRRRFEPRLAHACTDEAGARPPLFVNLDVAGVPASPPAPDAGTVKVERRLYTTEGKPWTPAPLKEGEALIVGVTVTSDVAIRDALLTDLLPAGLEVENFNLGDARQWADGPAGRGGASRSGAAAGAWPRGAWAAAGRRGCPAGPARCRRAPARRGRGWRRRCTAPTCAGWAGPCRLRSPSCSRERAGGGACGRGASSGGLSRPRACGRAACAGPREGPPPGGGEAAAALAALGHGGAAAGLAGAR